MYFINTHTFQVGRRGRGRSKPIVAGSFSIWKKLMQAMTNKMGWDIFVTPNV